MTDLASSFSSDVTRSLGWALLHFVWQGVALAAALSVLMAFCRRASLRYVLAVGVLVLMVAAPLVTFLLVLPPARPYAEWTRAASGAATAVWSRAVAAAVPTPPPVQQPVFQPDTLVWLVELWFAGVVLFSLRAAGGFILVGRLRRRHAVPLPGELAARCRALQRRLGIGRAVRFCESRLVAAPAVIGWLRPVVLLPVTALTGLSEPQLEAVIAHELAHIRRLDSLVNLFQVVAEVLLFYHPAVWWVSRRVRAERENCCDDAAILACGNAVEYARALTLMEGWRSAPVLVMAANRGPVTTRIRRLLGMGQIVGGIRSAGFAASFLCLAGAFIAGNALLGLAKTSFGISTPGKQAPAARRQGKLAARSVLNNQPTDANGAPAEWIAQAAPSKAPKGGQSTKGAGEGSSGAGQGRKEGFIEQMRAAGLKDLTVEQLVGMKTQGVTPEYVRQMRALGLSPDADQLIAMRVQGVTPEYIRDMRASGVAASAKQLVGMKVQGVTPEYVKAIHDLGLQPDADMLMGMRVQGVTPEYIREMRAAGVAAGAEQLVGMKVQGVTPEYVKAIHDLGLRPDADTLMGMRVQGVTPEYIREMQATGLKLRADHLMAMRVQGVTSDYVKTLQQAGLRDLNVDGCLAAKVQGITREFLEKVRQHGFQNLTVDKLIRLKHAGVL